MSIRRQKLLITTIALPHNSANFNEFVVELPGTASIVFHVGYTRLDWWFRLDKLVSEENWLLVSFSDQTKATEIELLST